MNQDIAIRKEAGGMIDFGAYSGAGFENQTIEDRKVPFIVALQGQSEAVVAEGSSVKAGQLFNTATGEAVDGKVGLTVLPVITERKFARMKPNQGGFVCRLDPTDPVVLAAQKRHDDLGLPFGKLFTAYDDDGEPAGDQLIDTNYVYVVVCDGKLPVGYAIIAFKSTDTGEYRRYFGTALREFMGGRSPLFAHPTRITTELRKYKVGAAYNLICGPADAPTIKENCITDASDPRFVEGVNLYKLVKQGLVKADFGNAAATSEAKSDDIPF